MCIRDSFLILGFVQGACVGFGIPVAETFGAKDKGGLRKSYTPVSYTHLPVSRV